MGIARAILAECIGYRIRLHVCLDLGFHRGNLFVKVSNISAVGNQRIALIFQLFERRHPPLGKFPIETNVRIRRVECPDILRRRFYLVRRNHRNIFNPFVITHKTVIAEFLDF